MQLNNPHRNQLGRLQHNRFGLFIHFGTYSTCGRGEWIKKMGLFTEERYHRYFHHFNPERYDPAIWARDAKNAGMRYAVITTKHHEGFCLWDSEYTDYKVTNTPYGKDLLRPFVDAFRAEGLDVCFYYSLIDWHHPHYTIDRLHPRSPRSTAKEDFAKLNEGRDMNIYRQYMKDQLSELLTNYGEIVSLWFDFSFGDLWQEEKQENLMTANFFPGMGPGPGKGASDWDSEGIVRMIHKLQPNCLINDRLGLEGSADFVTPEQYQPKDAARDHKGEAIAWEACQTFGGAWGYERDAELWKSPHLILQMLIDTVSKSGNMLLNVGPNGRGEFEPKAKNSLAFLGEWMELHQSSIYGCGAAPEGILTPTDCRLTYNPSLNQLFIHLFSWPFKMLHVEGLAGKVEYSQLLNDGSEIDFSDKVTHIHGHTEGDGNTVIFKLPTLKPPASVPVIQVFLK